MAYEKKDMSGVLFSNKEKESEKHPDYTGTALVNGDELRLAAWVNTAASGMKYMSIKFSVPRERRELNETPADESDDILF
jgi:uncharacterized protein (DUF736 family)